MGNNPVLTHEPEGMYARARYASSSIRTIPIARFEALDRRDSDWASIKEERKPAKLWTRKVVEYIFHDCDFTNPATIKPAPPEEFLTYTRRLMASNANRIVCLDIDKYGEFITFQLNDRPEFNEIYNFRKPNKTLTFSFVEYQARFYGFGLK